MTKPRAVVSASLAERGRPEMWANEQEAAALSGMKPETFASKVKQLEALGFPLKSAWNTKRFIPAIIDFWRLQQEEPELQRGPGSDEDDGRSLEGFHRA